MASRLQLNRMIVSLEDEGLADFSWAHMEGRLLESAIDLNLCWAAFQVRIMPGLRPSSHAHDGHRRPLMDSAAEWWALVQRMAEADCGMGVQGFARLCEGVVAARRRLCEGVGAARRCHACSPAVALRAPEPTHITLVPVDVATACEQTPCGFLGADSCGDLEDDARAAAELLEAVHTFMTNHGCPEIVDKRTVGDK
jgi:hypothetical protein